MRVLLGKDVILDVLTAKEPFVADSSAILRLCEEGRLDGYISVPTFLFLSGLMQESFSSMVMAYGTLRKLMELVRVASVTNTDILGALQRPAESIATAIAGVCAESIACDCIITRNTKAFSDFSVPTRTPSEILEDFADAT